MPPSTNRRHRVFAAIITIEGTRNFLDRGRTHAQAALVRKLAPQRYSVSQFPLCLPNYKS